MLSLEPVKPSHVNVQVPVLLDGIVAKAMAKRREERYKSAREFALALKQVVGDRAPALGGDVDQMSTIPGTIPGRVARPRSRMIKGGLGAAGLVAVIALVFEPLSRSRPVDVKPAPEPSAASEVAPASDSETQRLAARAKELGSKLNFTRDELWIAADLGRKATQLDAGSTQAWGARAFAEAAWINRNWDRGQRRLDAAQRFARRALAIDPDEPKALWALGVVLRTQGVHREAETLFRRALAASPKDNSIRRARATVVRIQGRDDEANALLDEALQVNPRDALAHLNWADYYARFLRIKDGRMENLEKALKHLDAALAIEPFATAIVHKAAIVAAWKGDLAMMRTTLDRLEELPLAERSDDRIIFVSMWGGLMERSPDRVLMAAALTTRTYFEDELVAEPVSWMLALAHRIAGRENLARQQWQEAETVVRQRLEESPRSSRAQGELGVTLAWLGRTDEAAEAFSRYDAIMRERGIAADLISAKYYTARGETARAVAVLRQMRNTSVWLTDHTLQFDPWWDILRGQPGFEALLAKKVARQWVAPRR